MKSKFFKVVLPAFATILALGLSSFTANDDDPIYYYDDPAFSGIERTTVVPCPGGYEYCEIIILGHTYQLYADSLLTVKMRKGLH